MIAVAVSSENKCFYCLTAHGEAVRRLSGDPALGEMMVMNFRAADLTPKTARDARIRGEDDECILFDRRCRSRRVARRRLERARHLGHRRRRELLQHDEPHGLRRRYAPEPRISRQRALTRGGGNPYYSGPVSDHFDGTQLLPKERRGRQRARGRSCAGSSGAASACRLAKVVAIDANGAGCACRRRRIACDLCRSRDDADPDGGAQHPHRSRLVGARESVLVHWAKAH